MKICYLLLSLLIVPVFAGQVNSDLLEPVSPANLSEIAPIPYVFERGETLKYDNGTFNNALGITASTTPFTPTFDQTYGFSTYFILSQFGITSPRKVGAVLVNFRIVNGTTFRLYVWNNVSGILSPVSEGPHLYSDLSANLTTPQTWGVWDLSAQNIVLPDTFWIGVCYNYLNTNPPGADWYLSLNTALVDVHSYINLSGTPVAWQALSGMGYGYAYGVEVVVEEIGVAHDVGTISIDIPSAVPQDTVFSPQATVANLGLNQESYYVHCTIEPGGYTAVDTVAHQPAGETLQVTFNDPFTFVNGTYTVTVYTELAGDENPANDTLITQVEARIGHDVGTISIDVPSTVPLDTTFSPLATVKNFGANAETFDVTCTIGAGAYTSTYNVVNLAPDDSLQVTFPDQFNFLSGFYTVTVFTELPTDEDLNNDTLEKVVEATGIAEVNSVIPTKFMFTVNTISKGKTDIEFSLTAQAQVNLAVYNAAGRLCEKLISNTLSAGNYTISPEFSLPTGVYFVNLKTDSGTNSTRKFLLIQ